MIYAKGNYDNTVSATNPNPVTVQSGLNTEDEMFIFIFQFLPYQLGDENIFIENNTTTTTYNIPINTPKGELIKITDILGRKTKGTNQPLFYIYDDGTVEKKIILE